MTSPAAVSVSFPINPGPAVKLTDGTGNSPAGCRLINPGTNGGTVWVSPGPTGAGLLPLGPGASLTWTDPAVLPYASLSSATAKPETLLVTSQAADYANPAATAAATALLLAAQGIPSTYLDSDFGTWQVQSTLSTVGITVGQAASLTVAPSWTQPTPRGLNVLRLTFDNPANPNSVPVSFYCTSDTAFDPSPTSWQVPVMGPRLIMTNVSTPDGNNSPVQATVVGSNRAVSRFRQMGEELGGVGLSASPAPVSTGVLYEMVDDTGSVRQTRFNGPVQLIFNTGQQSYLYLNFVTRSGRRASGVVIVPAGQSQLSLTHPSVPVRWQAQALTAAAGNYFSATIVGQS